VTIGELRALYDTNHVVNLKDRLGTSRRLQRYVAQFDALPLGELTKMQVVSWHQEIGRTRGGTAANQALQQLHAMYARAQDWELYDGKNPADRIKKFPRRSRERFVQSREMPYLLKSLSEEGLRVETYFLTLLLTGARRDQARLMQWSHVDLNRTLWHKPTTKTGVPHTVPLADQLVTRIRALPRVTAFVFSSSPNPKNALQAGEWSETAVEHFWRKIRRRVGFRCSAPLKL